MCDLASPYFSDCMGCHTENQFCDTRYRIDCDPSFVFFKNNCPYIEIHHKITGMKIRSFHVKQMTKFEEIVPVHRLKSKVE